MSTPGPSFRIRQVTLAGFGLYGRPTRFALADGPGVLFGPNESGKSTFLQGLAAVFFGLPTQTDPSRHGTARFRSLSRPKEFWGQVEWESDGRWFVLHRAFESHRVRLIEMGLKGAELLFEGEHNPRGTSSAASAFPEHLRARLGMSSLELFTQTFCLAQPLPEEGAIGSELQHLLSGSRAGRVDDVLDRLFGEVKGLTRATGDLALVRPGKTRATNQRDAGRIESLEAALRQAQDELEAGRGLLDQLNAHNEELEQAQEEMRRRKASIDQREGRLGALRQWLQWKEEGRRLQETLKQAKSALEQLRGVERERALLEPELIERFAAFRTAPADLGPLLEAIERAEEELRRAGEAAEGARTAREGQQARIGSLEQELSAAFGDVRGKPELPDLLEELVRRKAAWDARHDRIRELEERILEEERSLTPEGQWDGPPVEVLRAEAEALLGDLESCRTLEARLAEIQSQSEDRVFLGAERLKGLREKIAAEQRARDQVLLLRELEARLARLGEAAARAETVRVTARATARAPSFLTAPIRPWVLWPVSALCGLGLYLLPGSTVIVDTAGFALAAAVLLLLNWILLRRARRRAAPPPPSTEGTQPEAAETDEDVASLRARLAEARSQHERDETEVWRLKEDLGPFAQTTGPELAAMEARWAAFDQEAERLRAEKARLLRGRIALDEGDDWRALDVGSLPDALRFTRNLPGAPPAATAGELVAWLATLDRSAWERFHTEIGSGADARQRLAALRRQLESLREEESADKEVERLSARLAPHTAETPVEPLRDQVRASAGIEQELHTLRSRLSETPPPEDLERERAAAESNLNAALDALRQVWPEVQTPDPSAQAPPSETLGTWARRMREEDRQARPLWSKANELAASRGRVLETARAASREELEQRELEGTASLGSLLQRLEELERGEVLLSASREETDTMSRALRLQDLAESEGAEADADRGKLEDAAARERVLLRELASLEGRRAPNLARLEIQIRQMEGQLAEARRERDALALAFTWVREAAERFQNDYRGELENRITEHFRVLTGMEGRRVSVDESFALEVVESGGEVLAVPQMSQGARDQLLLSIRLAVADLLTGTVPLPLFFDDAFVHYDAARLEHLRSALGRLSSERQWILLTHRGEMASWAEPIRQEEIPT